MNDSVVIDIIKRGDQEAIQQLIKDGSLGVNQILCFAEDCHFCGEISCTLLLIAIRYGHTKIAENLIDAGAEINQQQTHHCITPLMYAAVFGHKEIIMLLISRGADIHAKDQFDKTALMYAAENGNTETVAFLVENKANLDAKDKYNNTALMSAVRKKHKQVVTYLLNNHADVNIQNKQGKTALMFAVKGDTEILKLLIDYGVDVNLQDIWGKTALTLVMDAPEEACNPDHLVKLTFLSNAHADFDINNPVHRDALQCAFKNYKSHPASFKILLHYLEKVSVYSVKTGKQQTQNLYIGQQTDGSTHEYLLIEDISSALEKLHLSCPLQEMAGSVIRKEIGLNDCNERIADISLPHHLISYLSEEAPPLSFKCRMVLDGIIAQIKDNSDF
ncbi:MAG: ankyrin repeat domain-containing protein [Endozoicomonadaceae bacterium]|nr:ankyrin repeat domain-containing protein [Endozoicomonadaceae bacterium]